MRRHPASPRAAGRRRLSSGQALVEFGLIAPLFFILFFSIIEFCLIMASIGSFDFAAREGARVGSIEGRTSNTVDQDIVSVVRNHVQGVVMAKTDEIDIYRAAVDGACLNTSSGSAGEVTVDDATCTKDQYNLDGTCVAGTGTCNANPPWPPSLRDDSVDNADYVGVRVKYHYTYITGFIAGVGSVLPLTATSVQRIEPQSGYRRPDAVASLAPLGLPRDIWPVVFAVWRPAGGGGGAA